VKIQTQFKLLIFGILIVPALAIISEALLRSFIERGINGEEMIEIPAYEKVAPLLEGRMNGREWQMLVRYAERMGALGPYQQLTIFRDDFFVLFSTIPEFTAGESVSLESLFSLLSTGNQRFEYNFTFSGKHAQRCSILWKRSEPLRPAGLPPPDVQGSTTRQYQNSSGKSFWFFYFPLVIAFIFILALIVFVICMSIVILRSITRSVQVLENATRRIAEGELDLAVDVQGNNEITSLTGSLNKMRDTLKEDERRRSRFIMGVTHDLKTPLALIKGYAEAIGDGLEEDLASRSSAAGIIAAKADQLEEMINDLIVFVRMESGEWKDQLKEVNLSGMLKNFAHDAVSDVELLRHRMTVDINLPDTLFLPMDERMVERALENLLSNAVRYTPPDTGIRLSAAIAEKSVRLEICDNGPGIAETDLPHIFEMFYRGTSSRREQGMGLGLSVVKGVVDSHGWTIQVNSNHRAGTCFCITIPLNPSVLP
jgi:signal transduction histidine kinase